MNSDRILHMKIALTFILPLVWMGLGYIALQDGAGYAAASFVGIGGLYALYGTNELEKHING